MRAVVVALLLCLALMASGQQRHSDGVDDVLQHVPMTSVLVLKACGVESSSASWTEFLLSAGASYVLSAGVTWSLKQGVSELRPDHSDRRSFPSGHATFAFAGATVLHHEYGHLSPWISVGGYGLATLTAIHRVAQDRHYVHDVCAGAVVGFASTELTYYLKRRLFKSKNVDFSFTGQTFDLTVRW